MSLRIEIVVPQEHVGGTAAREYLVDTLAAIGFAPADQRVTSGPAPLSDTAIARVLETTSGEGDTTPDPKPAESEKPARKPRESKKTAPATEQKVDDAATAEQDKADEKAEADKGKAKEPLTADDLRKVMSAYADAYGMDKAQEDGITILEKALGKPPAGEPNWKVSLVATDADNLQKAIDAWVEATEKNPFGRAKV